MPDYKKMYYSLFNQVSDAIKQLQEAQKESEEIFIDTAEDADDKDA